MQLAQLVERAAGDHLREALREQLAGKLCFRDRVGPVAPHLQQLGTVDAANTGVRAGELGARIAPSVERDGPFPGTAQLEDLVAGGDDAAIHQAGHPWAEITTQHVDHRLVEKGKSFLDPALLDAANTLAMDGERDEILVRAAQAVLVGLCRGLQTPAAKSPP
jgi:hypothetical protein